MFNESAKYKFFLKISQNMASKKNPVLLRL
ncbi:hypothetical protein Q787_05515 [Ornithobacterium rhinotracheale H06-030791]|nr:hypothetical protein Q785_05630 [Ornithobacterium rhinotracheale ORT-UMN 88]KGB67473.1 hypothetical protein Q787_05515 [Ornithobacterium rhinotracheale H06-030791]